MVSNKAQSTQYAIAFMLAVVVIILALAFAFPVNELTSQSRADTTYTNYTNDYGDTGQAEYTGMNCTGSAISDFTNAGCLVMDIGQGYFIIGLLGLAGIIIVGRVVFG